MSGGRDDGDVSDVKDFLQTGGALRGALFSQMLGSPGPPPPSLAPGATIGPWRIESLVGRGGMSEVYLARRIDPEFDQRVALKLIAAGIEAVELFRHERRILARLEHPGIATLIDAGQLDDGRIWFAMEFVDGIPLDEYVATRRLGWRERLELVGQLCDAVGHAHAHLLVHRDIKPSNVLVGADGRARLIDFGIAVALGSDAPRDRFMTPAFAAPEQVVGAPITISTDVYQLGRVLAELLLPLGKPSPSLPRSLPSSMSRDLARIVATATARRPGDRHSSVAALADDVAALREQRPLLHAGGAGIGHRCHLFLRRHAIGSALAAVALVAAVSGVALLAHSRAREAAERELALREEQTVMAIGSFFVDLFNEPLEGASPEAGGVGALLDRAQQRLLGPHDGDPEIRIALLQALAQVNVQMERTAMARTLLEDAITRQRRGATPPSLALSLATLARLEALSGAHDTGVALAGEAASLLDQDAARDSRLRFLALVQLAEYYVDALRFESADRTIAEALRVGRARYGDASPELLRARRLQANALQYRWRVDEALPLSEALVRDCEGARGVDDAACIVDRIHLQRMRGLAGDLEAAAGEYEVLLARSEQWHGERRRYRRHSILFGLSEVLWLQGQHAAARLRLQESLDELYALGEREGPHLVSDRGALAQLLLDDGEPDAALALSSADRPAARDAGASLEDAFWALRQARIELAAGELSVDTEVRARDALDAMGRTYGESSHFASKARITVAMIDAERGAVDAALARADEATRADAQGLAFSHPQLLAEAAMLRARLVPNETASASARAVRLLADAFGASHPLTREAEREAECLVGARARAVRDCRRFAAREARP
jgi:hypothetical protein